MCTPKNPWGPHHQPIQSSHHSNPNNPPYYNQPINPRTHPGGGAQRGHGNPIQNGWDKNTPTKTPDTQMPPTPKPSGRLLV